MATNYITKEYLVKQLQGFADKLATIYEKQENIQFKVIDKYSDLTEPKVSTICYILNAETIDVNVYEKGFYLYNINNAIPTWQYISVSGSDFELNPWQPGTDYVTNKIVYKDFKAYKCLVDHTSTTNFEDDLLLDKWVCIIGTDSEELPVWEADKEYVIGDKVKESGIIYESIKDHTSTIFVDDKDNWIKIIDDYVVLTQEQQDYLIENNLIEDKLYVVTDVSDEGSSSDTSGNLTTDLISNITVGGVSANTKYTKGTSLETIIKDILVKYFPADLVFSLNPSKILYKIGDIVNTIDMIANVTKKSENIKNIKYYIDGTLVDTKDETTNTGIENGGTYTYTHSTPFSTDTTFKVDVYDGKNTTTKTIKVEFVNPFYYGLASDTLQEIVQKKGTFTYNNITCNNDSIVFKYPKSYGTLTSILDSNNFENISAFTRSEEVINGVDYYVYTSAVTTVTNFKFIFKF